MPNHPQGIPQSKYNYVIKTKSWMTCSWKLVDKKMPFFLLMNEDPTIKNLGIQPHAWNHMYMLLPLIVQN